MITALAGGVGAARFLQGLVKIVPEEEITVIVNTGDDIDLYGLHISPDLDIVMYTLAGIVDEEKGWGIRDDTFHCLDMLGRYGHETWFNIGDKDFATHIYRTHLLRNGLSLSEATKTLCQKLGLKVKILPMTDDKFETTIVTPDAAMHFQEYLVKRQAKDKVVNVLFEGGKEAKPAPEVVDSILNAKAVIICPSNPIVSIGAILFLNDIKKAIKETEARVAAVSPIVGGSPVKGPADKLMQGLGLDVSACAVASLYLDFLDVFIIDQADRTQKKQIENLGLHVVVTDTVMKSLEDKIRLAKVTLESVGVR
ncbi:2-phospho-L-lactate transferase [Candidatus Bathyarchaeota archaeon]|nr:2-phospho-L-lactate transferase [Candidatus Bathyarchaeota archaeon]MBS7628772.1 2-phospho-L-lactate transferase [Candidatus Bathyarchaeota archaeon]